MKNEKVMGNLLVRIREEGIFFFGFWYLALALKYYEIKFCAL